MAYNVLPGNVIDGLAENISLTSRGRNANAHMPGLRRQMSRVLVVLVLTWGPRMQGILHLLAVCCPPAKKLVKNWCCHSKWASVLVC